eukprot:Amastigsp_a841667_33.p3 type:complete len:105 gc:universal Amastigsp_a841667_33:581-267(-)
MAIGSFARCTLQRRAHSRSMRSCARSSHRCILLSRLCVDSPNSGDRCQALALTRLQSVAIFCGSVGFLLCFRVEHFLEGNAKKPPFTPIALPECVVLLRAYGHP